jgi:hypothetical protein
VSSFLSQWCANGARYVAWILSQWCANGARYVAWILSQLRANGARYVAWILSQLCANGARYVAWIISQNIYFYSFTVCHNLRVTSGLYVDYENMFSGDFTESNEDVKEKIIISGKNRQKLS